VILRDLPEAITRENILLRAPKVLQHLSPEPQKEAPDFFGIIFHKEPIFLDTSLSAAHSPLATRAPGIQTWKGNTMTSSSSAAKGAPQWAQNRKG
jgi:hypothetical protein